MDPRTDPFPFRGGTMSPLGARAYAPVLPSDFVGLKDDEEWEIVGESKYLEGIHRLRTLAYADGDGVLYAILVAEPLNPFDHNAVRVDLMTDDFQRETCGYLPREQAYRKQSMIKAFMDDGFIPIMKATLYGGTADKPNIGVWLSAPPTEGATDYAKVRAEREYQRLLARTASVVEPPRKRWWDKPIRP